MSSSNSFDCPCRTPPEDEPVRQSGKHAPLLSASRANVFWDRGARIGPAKRRGLDGGPRVISYVSQNLRPLQGESSILQHHVAYPADSRISHLMLRTSSGIFTDITDTYQRQASAGVSQYHEEESAVCCWRYSGRCSASGTPNDQNLLEDFTHSR